LLFYDRATANVVDEYTMMPPCSRLQLSSDGKYVISNEGPPRILRLKADHTIEHVVTEPIDGKVTFDPEGSGNVIVGCNPSLPNGAVLIRDPTTGTALNVYPTPQINVLDIDVATSRIVGRLTDGGGTVVYDYDNLQELARFQLSTWNISLDGDYLYSPEGARLKIIP
jgi:hypothetical protein